MVTVDDYKITGTKLTVFEEKCSIYVHVCVASKIVAALLSVLYKCYYACIVAKSKALVFEIL